jgi:hypothetical protein
MGVVLASTDIRTAEVRTNDIRSNGTCNTVLFKMQRWTNSVVAVQAARGIPERLNGIEREES